MNCIDSAFLRKIRWNWYHRLSDGCLNGVTFVLEIFVRFMHMFSPRQQLIYWKSILINNSRHFILRLRLWRYLRKFWISLVRSQLSHVNRCHRQMNSIHCNDESIPCLSQHDMWRGTKTKFHFYASKFIISIISGGAFSPVRWTLCTHRRARASNLDCVRLRLNLTTTNQ